ncbi:Phenylacetate-coenzyme A ligase [Vibrio aerogenes CECT 7868]|uniref:Phenylacetate-coenzyme A ligase n=1 Tax=Vibrio aerogenes CECT 7868 TaxID=1216006 RepID=A0A1M5UWT7_9VIBR|nr:AMP-binding protein [Vibrio aerogenes]SHH67445.1 Phenylacetate-coenzyme A ligase [Vibrio aerogenes CECT 7868]
MYAIFKQGLYEKAKAVYEFHQRFEEGGVGPDELKQYQELQLRQVLGYVRQGSEFYRKQLEDFSEQVCETMTLHQLKLLPFTTKEQMRQARTQLPSAPLHESWVYYETTGTTGAPTPCPRSETDSMHNNTPLILRYRDIFSQHGSQHIVGVMGPTELHSTGDTFEDVMRSLGHSVVKMWPRSPVVGMKRAVALIEELGITALVCTPAVAIDLARYMIDAGKSAAESPVRLILTLGELTTPALLRNLGHTWGAKIYNCMYASQESSILAVCAADECLYTVPLNNYYELIDPDSGALLTPGDDELAGELVITHLYPGQKPLIRYRTGDMVRAVQLPDGRLKITPVGRVRDRLILNGTEYYAWDLEAALLEHLPGCLDYAIQIQSENGSDCLNIIAELTDTSAHDAGTLAQVKAYMEAQLAGVTIELNAGQTSALTATSAMVSWKAARLHDLRQEGDNSDRDAALALLSRGFRS